MELYLALDVGGTNTEAGLVSASGEVIASHLVPSHPHGSRDQVLAVMDAALAPFTAEEAVALGVGFPSFGDYEVGILDSERSAYPSMNGFHLKEYLERKWGLPTRVVADANLFALGIARFGEGHSHSDFMALSLGTGIAIGLVRDGQVLGGAKGYPESTMRAYNEWLWPQAWDHSGYRFEERYGADPVTMRNLARDGDAKACAVFDQVGRALAITIKRLARETGLNIAVIGGGLAEAYELFEPSLVADLKESGVAVLKTALEKPALLGARALFAP